MFPRFPVSVSSRLGVSLSSHHLLIPVSPRHAISASLLFLSPHLVLYFPVTVSPFLRITASLLFPIPVSPRLGIFLSPSSLHPRFTASCHLRVFFSHLLIWFCVSPFSLSPCLPLIPSPQHPISLSPRLFNSLSPFHRVTLSPCLFFSLRFAQSIGVRTFLASF